MRIVLGTLQLDAWAGTETYVLTLAEQLQRLGHETSIYTQKAGAVAEEATRRGIHVHTDLRHTATPDVTVVQDAAIAYELAAEWPDAPQLYVAHSAIHDVQLPPQLPGVVQLVVAMNDRVAHRVSATSLNVPLVRLAQPVDIERFEPAGALPARPQRALLLGNYLDGSRREMVFEACAEAGIEATQLGAHIGRPTSNAASAIGDAHIVIGQGRAIIEAMARGRAAYVFDRRGSGGWVTPDSYPALAADGFVGLMAPRAIGRAELLTDLAAYEPSMGAVNAGLASGNHDARRHATELAIHLGELAPKTSQADLPLREMGRLVQLQWATWAREQAIAQESVSLREGRDRAESGYQDLLAAHAQTVAELEELKACQNESSALSRILSRRVPPSA